VFKCWDAVDRLLGSTKQHDYELAVAATPEELLNRHSPPINIPPKQPEYIPNEYLVALKSTVQNPNEVATKLAESGAIKILHVYSSRGFNGFAAYIPPDEVAKVRNHPTVRIFEQNMKFYKEQQIIPTGVRRVGADRSSFRAGKGFGSVNATIAVLDTGCDRTHPDLNVVLTMGFGAANISGVDGDGHGTHVAGIAAARDNNLGVVGVAPGARLWGIKVLDDTGAGTTADILAGIDFIAQNAGKVQVANMSFGGGFSLILNDATDNLVRSGVVVTASAGNTSIDATLHSPGGSAVLAFSVAAMADSDGQPGGRGPSTSAGPDDTFADFSNFGTLVDVLAPGVDILSTFPGNRYQVFSGSSQAAPHVAGLVAIARRSDRSPVRNFRSPTIGAPGTPPDQVELLMRRAVREHIRGITQFGDQRPLYPLLNAQPF
jgi:subtilisin family serine protease